MVNSSCGTREMTVVEVTKEYLAELRAENERLKDENTAQLAAPTCNPHPDAPHGFSRNSSHSAGRYVCECEGWEPPDASSQIAELENNMRMWIDAAVDLTKTNEQLREQIAKLEAILNGLNTVTYPVEVECSPFQAKRYLASTGDAARHTGRFPK